MSGGPTAGRQRSDGPQLRSMLDAVGVDVDRSEEFGNVDAGARLVAIGLSQTGCRDPLPTELLEACDTFEELSGFAGVRREQEGG